MNTPDKDELNAVLVWLDQFQGLHPKGVDFADPMAASKAATAQARSAAQGLPFDSEPTGFTKLLESLARTDDA
tara:strand:+ start:768 stop:986 length:219 start_codon:yes stop_codon:yes gene_type:complete